MRIWSPFTFISLFAIASAVAATACDLSSPDYSSCGSSYSPSCGSSSYGGSSGYYPTGTPDAALPASCNEAFSVTFPIQANSGDCELVLSGYSAQDSYQSSYGKGTATYFFGELRSPSAYSEPCTVISGPSIGRCERLGALLVLASTTSSDPAKLRSELGLESYQATFYGKLTCTHLGTPVEKTFAFRCGTSTPATPSTGDAGTGDAAPDGGADSGDDADAGPDLLH